MESSRPEVKKAGLWVVAIPTQKEREKLEVEVGILKRRPERTVGHTEEVSGLWPGWHSSLVTLQPSLCHVNMSSWYQS